MKNLILDGITVLAFIALIISFVMVEKSFIAALLLMLAAGAWIAVFGEVNFGDE